MEIIGRQLEGFKDIEINKILENKKIFSSLQLYKCILGLNPSESKIFGYIMNNKNITTAELSSLFKMDRSSIQRALQTLTNLKLIRRDSMSMKNYVVSKNLNPLNKKGYVYVYNSEHMGSIKKELKGLLDKWYESMLAYIENLDYLAKLGV